MLSSRGELKEGAGMLLCCSFCCMFPLLGWPIAQIIVGAKALNDDACKQGWISLPTYLLVVGSVSLGFVVLGGPILFNHLRKSISSKADPSKIARFAFIIGILLGLALGIIGILAYRNNTDCDNSDFKHMTIATLVFLWLGVLCSFLTLAASAVRSRNNDGELADTQMADLRV
jgi:predicted outer membrane lipoprotein